MAELAPGERVLLTGYCTRNNHIVFRVLETPGGLVVNAELFAAGRERETWVPDHRRPLVIGVTARYGCPCRRSALVGHDQMWDRIRRGKRQMPVEVYNISRR